MNVPALRLSALRLPASSGSPRQCTSITSARLCAAVLGLSVAAAWSAPPARAQESALPGLRGAARAAPRDYDAQLALGRALIAAGHEREAGTTLARAARLRRGDPLAAFEAARAAFATGDYRSARRQCQAILRADQAAAIGHVCMARAFLAWRRSARAFEEIEAALAASPDDFEGLLALGDAHRMRGSVDEAAAAYGRAIIADGARYEPHLGLGQLYAQARRAAEARASLERAHTIAPNHPEVDYQLGRLMTGPEAITHLRDALTNRPGWAEAERTLADALLAGGDHAAAIPLYRAAITHDANLVTARAGLGRALAAAGALPEAESTLREALERVPNDSASAMALADVFVRTDRVDEAYTQYQHAADVDPRDPAPLLAAARLALEHQRPVLATGFLRRVLSQHPGNAAAQALLRQTTAR